MAEERFSEEKRTVNAVDQLDLRDVGQMTIIQGEEESLVLRGRQEILEKIVTQVEVGCLIIELGRDWLEKIFSGTLTSQSDIHYILTVREMKRITASGSHSIEVNGFTANNLELVTSGSETITINGLICNHLCVKTSGHAQVNLNGHAEQQDIHISGGCHYQASDLECNRADVKISGTGQVSLCVTEALNVRISGSGQVEYSGSPKVAQQISGAGYVRQKKF